MKDLDGIFAAILVYRQLSKQGIDPRHIVVEPIQYGTISPEMFKKQKGQMIALVDFSPSRVPEGSERPDFWSDHHQIKGEILKSKSGGRVGAEEYPSETEHLATVNASGLADLTTIKAISNIDAARYSNLEDVLNLPKDFKEKGRMDRLAIITTAVLGWIINNKAILSNIIKTTNPSLVALYQNVLKHTRLADLQKEAVEELAKTNPDWKKIESIRNRMPTMEMKKQIVKEDTETISSMTVDHIYWAGRDWPKFNYEKGLDALIQKDETGECIYWAGKHWKQFNYEKGLNALKKFPKYYEAALEKWPKGIKQSQEMIDELKKDLRNLKINLIN